MRTHPALGATEGWQARFSRELNATDDRDAFRDSGRPGDLPVMEGKHIEPFLVHQDRCERFIPAVTARERLPDARYDHARLVYRDVSGVGNRFTLVSAVMPAGAVTTHTLFCLRNEVPLVQQYFLCGLFNSQVLNRVVRMLMGSHVTTSLVESLPVPRWLDTPVHRSISRLSRRLSAHRLGDRRRTDLLVHLNEAVEAIYGANSVE